MAFCIPFTHRFVPGEGPGSGFTYQRCARCGKVKVTVAAPLLDQMPPRLDVDPNPKRWTPGPGVSSGGEVGVRNKHLARGYANED